MHYVVCLQLVCLQLVCLQLVCLQLLQAGALCGASAYHYQAPSNYKSLLQKNPTKETYSLRMRPIIVRSLLIVGSA